MALEQLFDRQRPLKVVLLYTSSNNMSLFIQDVIKNRYNISKDNVMSITTKKDLNRTKEVYNVVPFLSDRWFFHVKQGDKVVGKDFLKLARENTSGVYFIEFENYRNYKTVKTLLGKESGVLDLYLGFLRRNDFHILYNREVVATGGYQLPKVLLDFVSKGYSGEIDVIFNLFNVLKEGTPVKTRKEIIDICGLSSNTIDNFMFSLLKEPTTSDKGLKKYISNRLKEAIDLAEKYTWSKFRSFLKNSVKYCIDIKMILSSGEVYDNIKNYENEGYETSRLVRYQRFLPIIKSISITRFLGLLENLEKRVWRSDIDFLTFFYNYMVYKYKANETIKLTLQTAMKESRVTKSATKDRKVTVTKKLKVPSKSEWVLKHEKEGTAVRNMIMDKLSNYGGVENGSN